MSNAKEFYQIFLKEVKEEKTWHGEKYLKVYSDYKAFTSLINKYVVPKILKNHFKLKPENEYYRIDCIGYESRYTEIGEKTKEVKLNPHFWDLKVAVEHENNNKDFLDEVIKLMHIHCPLKVVIGYTPCDEREILDKARLEFVAECMKKLSIYGNIGKNEEFLLILGNSAPSSGFHAMYTKFDYRGYLYNYEKGEFDTISPTND